MLQKYTIIRNEMFIKFLGEALQQLIVATKMNNKKV